jgi:hypothetical protein
VRVAVLEIPTHSNALKEHQQCYLSTPSSPVCKTYELGSLSNSRRPKSKFKTCGSTICSTKLKAQNHKSGAKFTRLIKEYTGNDLCDYNCGSYARYEFSSGKKCCHSIASNCPLDVIQDLIFLLENILKVQETMLHPISKKVISDS